MFNCYIRDWLSIWCPIQPTVFWYYAIYQSFLTVIAKQTLDASVAVYAHRKNWHVFSELILTILNVGYLTDRET